jgi:DNA-directed RNA polymerase delta subunit
MKGFDYMERLKDMSVEELTSLVETAQALINQKKNITPWEELQQAITKYIITTYGEITVETPERIIYLESAEDVKNATKEDGHIDFT